jgi:hypothetical protein
VQGLGKKYKQSLFQPRQVTQLVCAQIS